MAEKNLELERLVFFSDAVVAIAITLLALDLKIDKTVTGHLLFTDLGVTWHKFAAFFLSFFIIAAFWKVHHEFFHYIRRIDNFILWFNMGWLLFIVILPFSSSLVSDYFFDKASIFYLFVKCSLHHYFSKHNLGLCSSKVWLSERRCHIRYYEKLPGGLQYSYAKCNHCNDPFMYKPGNRVYYFIYKITDDLAGKSIVTYPEKKNH